MTNWEDRVISQEDFIRRLVVSSCTISKGELVLCSDADCNDGNCEFMNMCHCGEKKKMMWDWFFDECGTKPTIRLTQLEKDIIEYFKKEEIFKDVPFLAMLKVFGHFKEVDVEDSLGEIIKRSVVVAAY